MISVTMSNTPSPPLYNPSSGLLTFPVGSGAPKLRDQINAYYETHFRQRQMETFAQFVLEKGHEARTPNGAKNSYGEKVPETWQQCGRRLFGDRFVPIMEQAIAAYRAKHGAPPVQAVPEPPAYITAEIPEPDF